MLIGLAPLKEIKRIYFQSEDDLFRDLFFAIVLV